MWQKAKNPIKTVGPLRWAARQRHRLGVWIRQCQFPPGHYYSPIPALEEIRLLEDRIFDRTQREIPDVDLNAQGQLALLESLSEYYEELPFAPRRRNHLRYYYENPFYSYGDAIFLYGMVRHARPKRIIEIGSGFSSCVFLDTNELFFEGRIRCTLIEPYPDRLHSLLKEGDEREVTILAKKLQDVSPQTFAPLEPNDILFVDSSHVTKVGSDVNRIFFELLPALAPGVLVHFHDVHYPFEYPKQWVYQGRAWNEAYLLRAFLQYNDRFTVKIWNQFLGLIHRERLERAMPLCMKNLGGSIWLQKQ